MGESMVDDDSGEEESNEEELILPLDNNATLWTNNARLWLAHISNNGVIWLVQQFQQFYDLIGHIDDMVEDEESNFVGFKGFVELDCEHKADLILSLEIQNVMLNY